MSDYAEWQQDDDRSTSGKSARTRCLPETIRHSSPVGMSRAMPGAASRSYDKGAQIEDPVHLQTLVEEKRAARHHRGVDRLAAAVPAAQDLLQRAAGRGDNLGTITADLLRLLDQYGAVELDAAIQDALARDVPHPNAVRLALDRRREQRNAPPPFAIDLPDHVKTRDTTVRPHRLETYDRLKDPTNGGGDDE